MVAADVQFEGTFGLAFNSTNEEVDRRVEPEELDPNFIHTPGIFVQRIFQGEKYEKRIEQLTVRKREG